VLAGALVVWLLALRAAGRVDVLSAMKEGASAPRRQAAFAALFALQLAIALFLGATAVSFVDALQTLAGRSYPFRTEKLLLFDVNFRNLGVTNDSVSLAEKFLARIRTVPGVVAAGGGPAPLAGVGWSNVIVDGRDPALEPDKGFANMANATGDYFPAAGIRVRQGRAVTSQEVLNKAKAIVINTALAKRYWPGKDPIGRAMKPWDGGADYTVVGVVDDVPADTSGKTPPQFYLPWGAASGANLTFHVAVQSDSAEMRKAIVASLSDVWPAKTPPPLRSIRDQIGEVSTELQTAVRVVFWLAGFATLVTSCGLYFFSSYTAAQTLRDSAIRQALGARWTHLVGSHLARYRVGLGCGLGLGVGLLIGARPLFAYLGIASIPMTASYIVLAAVLLLVLALIGLCVPLRKVLRLNLARILGQGT
jgi:putative ABC transport system permease protein